MGTTSSLSDEERQAELARFEAHRARLNLHLSEHAALFEAVRTRVQPLWEGLADGRTFPRKPSWSLRLFAADAQTLIGVSPVYQRHRATVDCERIVCEVIRDVARYHAVEAPVPFYKLDRCLTVNVEPGRVPRWSQASWSAEDAFGTLVEVLAQFLEDPALVFGRATRFCAICGRGLTDGQSCARGIGPECLRQASTFLAYDESILGLVAAAEKIAPL